MKNMKWKRMIELNGIYQCDDAYKGAYKGGMYIENREQGGQQDKVQASFEMDTPC